MNIERSQLETAIERGIITDAQAAQLWALLQERGGAQAHNGPSFTVTHVLYYLGGLIALGGMSLYVTLGWERLSGVEIFLVAAAYAVAGFMLTRYLLEVKELPVPAGITAAFIVAMTPLAVYGLQRAAGLWEPQAPYRAYHTLIDGRWIVMELATLAVGLGMLWLYRLPFLLMPVAVTLWYMSMDLAPIVHALLYGADAARGGWSPELWHVRQWVSVLFGLAVIAAALLADLRSTRGRDFALWLYLAGVAAFWGGLTSMEAGSELGRLLYCLINVGLLFIGAVLSRRVFTVFGALGVASYLGYLAYRVFAASILFPIALTGAGFAVIYLGILWQRHEQEISQRLRSYLPDWLRKLVEERERSP
jgi:hypothetical protein